MSSTFYDSDATYDSGLTYDAVSPPAVDGVITAPVPGGTPHLQIPFTISDLGPAATVEQGTLTEITQCVGNLVGTRPGTRLMVPRFGLPDPTFAGVDPVSLRMAAAKYEPRAAVSVTVAPGSEENVVVSVAVAGAA